MQPTPRATVLLTALGVGVLQIVGSIGAANNQPDRNGLDVLAVVLLLIGPAALAVRDRFPLTAIVASTAAAAVYIANGYPYGPIFFSIVVALYNGVQLRRKATWVLAGLGYVSFLVAEAIDPRAANGLGWLHLMLVAGWLLLVLTVSEVVRVRKEQRAEQQRLAREARERAASEQRLRLAQELHDVLAHNIALINVQASVALHLLDEHPDQARPALATIKEASHDALSELRTALDVLRNAVDVPRMPAPRLADLDELIDGVRAGGLEVHFERGATDRASGRSRARRVPDRAGGTHQRDPARARAVGRRARGTRRRSVHRGARRRRRRQLPRPATASPACANGRPRSAAPSRPAVRGGGFRVVAHLPVATQLTR